MIGTLLGSVSPLGLVQVRDAFAVPFTENGENGKVAVDMQYHRTMMKLHQQATPGLTIVGWYATGTEICKTSVMIHDFYIQEMGASAVHLTVDTSLTNLKLSVSAFVGVPLALGETVGSLFEPLEASIALGESDKIGLATVARAIREQQDNELAAATQSLADYGNVTALLRRIKKQIDCLQQHTTAVVAGKADANADVGVALFEVLQALPAMRKAEFDAIFKSDQEDLVIVSYLAKLVQVQLSLAEKVGEL